ncbi:MAG: hypothetical protein H0X24_00540 [Ktedonobacterales bacterium]|nr:hypothetical protein [Ktedonobacterales bacterium]
MTGLTLFGASAVTTMLLAYLLERRSSWWVLTFRSETMMREERIGMLDDIPPISEAELAVLDQEDEELAWLFEERGRKKRVRKQTTADLGDTSE